MPLLTAIARPHRRVTPATDPLNNAVLSLSPVAWWKGDETSGSTMFDYSGNNYHATYTGVSGSSLGNTPIRTGSARCPGMTNTSGAFPVANVSTATYPGLLIGLTSAATAMTMACFVKCTGGGSTLQKIMGYGQVATGVNEGLGNLQYRNSANSRGRDWAGNYIISGTSTLNTVVFLALTKASGVSTNVWTLYENGTSVGTITTSYLGSPSKTNYWDIMGATSNSPPIGPDAPTTTQGMTGFGSDFMLFNTALNSTQLTAIAHAGGLV